MPSDPWRHRCPDCGSVELHRRVELGGYRCGVCGAILGADERVDAKREGVA